MTITQYCLILEMKHTTGELLKNYEFRTIFLTYRKPLKFFAFKRILKIYQQLRVNPNTDF